MKMNTYSSFLFLPVLLILSTSIESRIPKKTDSVTPDQSNTHWHNYGDNWSQWANNWSTGWSEDDKHTTDHGSQDTKSSHRGQEIVENESMTLFGSKEMTKKRVKKNLTVYGAGILSDVHVGDVLTNYGRLKASLCSFNQLDAYGCTALNKCTVHQNTKIYGLLDAHTCTFKSSLITWSTQLNLVNSTVHSDVVIKRDKGTKKQRVELHDTIIEGSITFEKNKGTVILKGTSCVKGDVIGGTVVKK